MGIFANLFQLWTLAIILANRKPNSLNILLYLPSWFAFCLRRKGWNHLWWLILCVNLTGLSSSQRPAKMFPGVSVRVFLERVSTGISKPSNYHAHLCRWVAIPSIQGRSGTKRQRKGEFTQLELGHLSSPGVWHRCSWFSSSQMANGATSQPPVTGANLYKKSPLIYIYIIGSVSLENPDWYIILLAVAFYTGSWEPKQRLWKVIWLLMRDSNPESRKFLTLNSAASFSSK